MKHFLLVIIVCVLALWGGGCSKPETAPPENAKKRSPGIKFHGEGGASPLKVITKTPVADLIKKKKLNAFPQKTVGEAFDTYGPAVSREWKDDLGRDGSYYIDYICWFSEKAVTPEEKKAGIVQKGLDLKFVVHEEGEAYVALAMKLYKKADGTVQTDYFDKNEIVKVVSDIYNNRELVF